MARRSRSSCGGPVRTTAGVLSAGVLSASVALLALTACTSQPGTSTPHSNTGSSVSSVAPSAPATSTGVVPPDGKDAKEILPTAAAPDPSSANAALLVADKLMVAFARPTVDATTWINGLYPYLTQSGGAAYEGTDPAKVPVHHVTGIGTVVEGATVYALIVRIPTDIGDYTISLTRQRPTDPWLADRVTPSQK